MRAAAGERRSLFSGGGVHLIKPEATEQYNWALKQGRKCYKDCILHGRYPYPQVLDEILERLARERRAFLTVKTQDGFRRLPLRSIVYGELAGRRIQYHLTDGSVVKGMSLRGSFQDAVRPLLAHRRFVLCTASFFVNLAFVEVAGPSGLKLTGGSALPLSRALRAEVTSRWMDYCFGEEPPQRLSKSPAPGRP